MEIFRESFFRFEYNIQNLLTQNIPNDYSENDMLEG